MNAKKPTEKIVRRKGGYRLDGGVGAVLCDRCRRVIDGHLSHKKYLLYYGHLPELVCWQCREAERKCDE